MNGLAVLLLLAAGIAVGWVLRGLADDDTHECDVVAMDVWRRTHPPVPQPPAARVFRLFDQDKEPEPA